jgi:cytochrome c2
MFGYRTFHMEEITVRKATYFVLLAVLIFTAPALAQYSDPLLGPHNVAEKGCRACHAPHNGAVMNGGTDKGTGELYLWGRDFKTGTYYTFGYDATTSPGETFTTVASPGHDDPVIHTQLCMSCHDGGISDATMSSDSKLPNDGYSLMNDHPVHVEYAVPSASSPHNWNISITQGSTGSYRASFVDTTWRAGHPVRLFMEQSTGKAFIECSSCHNPHSFNRAVMKIAGQSTVKTSSRFVRGWYDPADGQSKSDFCRSCHYSKSDAYDGTLK